MNLEPLIGNEILRKRENPIYVAVLASLVIFVVAFFSMGVSIATAPSTLLQVIIGVAGFVLFGFIMWFIVNATRVFIVFGDRGCVRFRGHRILRSLAYPDLTTMSYSVRAQSYHGIRLATAASLTLKAAKQSISVTVAYPSSQSASATRPACDVVRDLASTAIADTLLARVAAGESVAWSRGVSMTAEKLMVKPLLFSPRIYSIDALAFGNRYDEDTPIDPETTVTYLWLRGTTTTVAPLFTGGANYYPGLIAFQELQLARLEAGI